jgi:hypothetical protein
MTKSYILMEAFLLWSKAYRLVTSWKYVKYEKSLMRLKSMHNPEEYKMLWEKTGKLIQYKEDKVNVIQSLGETWKKKVADCNGFAYLASATLGVLIIDEGEEYIFDGVYCGTSFKDGHYVAVWKCEQNNKTIYVDNQELGKGFAWQDGIFCYPYVFRLNSSLKILEQVK